VRCRRLGLKVLYWPAVRLIHHENVSLEYKSQAFWWMHQKGRLWLEAKNLSFGDLIFRALPGEIGWFCGPGARYLRRMMLGIYWMVFKRWLMRRVLQLKPLQ
jgi:GT2 family glycosyltransferase